MVIEVCHQQAHELQPWKISRLCFKLGPSLLRPNLPRSFGVFFPGPRACLPCWLEAQLLTQVRNCSQINHGPGYQWTAAGQHHSLALPTWSHSAAAGVTVSPSLDTTGKVSLATNLSFQCPSLAGPTRASGKFKSIMSGPVTSWGRGRIRAGRQTPASWEGTVQHQCRFYCVYTLY